MQITHERIKQKAIFTLSIQSVQQRLTFALSALCDVVSSSSCLRVAFLYCICTHLNAAHLLIHFTTWAHRQIPEQMAGDLTSTKS